MKTKLHSPELLTVFAAHKLNQSFLVWGGILEAVNRRWVLSKMGCRNRGALLCRSAAANFTEAEHP